MSDDTLEKEIRSYIAWLQKRALADDSDRPLSQRELTRRIGELPSDTLLPLKSALGESIAVFDDDSPALLQPNGELDDVFGQAIIERVAARCEEAISRCGYPLPATRPFVATLPAPKLQALCGVIPFLDVDLILAHRYTFSFCGILTKILSFGYPNVGEPDASVTFNLNPEAVQQNFAKLPTAAYAFMTLLMSFTRAGRPEIRYFPPQAESVPFYHGLLSAIELFIVAHEYGHIILRELKGNLGEFPSYEEEHLADFLALRISLAEANESGNLFALSGAGAAVLFMSMEVIAHLTCVYERRYHSPETQSLTHPAPRARYDALCGYRRRLTRDLPGNLTRGLDRLCESLIDSMEFLYESGVQKIAEICDGV